ncbi:MAG: carbohydrate kinase family protein, partial [Anaerolineae bacterium]
HVIVIGAASIDMKGRPRKRLVPATSNPGRVKVSIGGVGRNIAENLVRLGVPTTLLSAVGNDAFASQVLETSARAGIDVSQVLICRGDRTATYLAILDEEGSLISAIDDMGIMSRVTPQYIYRRRRHIKGAAMMVLDANLQPKAIRSAVNAAKRYNIPVCADPTSTHLAPRLRKHLKDLFIITPNVSEAEVLCGRKITNRFQPMDAAQELVSLGVKMAIITLAEEGLCYATSGESGRIPAIRCQVVDNTGAGDALSAAVVFGLLNDFPVDEAVRLGVSAATLTLQCADTVCPDLSLERLYDQLVI